MITMLGRIDYGNAVYAGQTFSCQPEGKRLHIGWMRGTEDTNSWDGCFDYEDMPFSQCMSLPTQLTLHQKDGAYHLQRRPLVALEKLRLSHNARHALAQCDGWFAIPAKPGQEWLVTLPIGDGTTVLSFGGKELAITPIARTIAFPFGRQAMLPAQAANWTIRLFLDKTTLGGICKRLAACSYTLNGADTRLRLRSPGVPSAECCTLKNIFCD